MTANIRLLPYIKLLVVRWLIGVVVAMVAKTRKIYVYNRMRAYPMLHPQSKKNNYRSLLMKASSALFVCRTGFVFCYPLLLFTC